MVDSRSPFLRGALSWLYDGAATSVCPKCDYDWSTPHKVALEIIEHAPGRFERALEGRDGMAPQADGSWNATAYVWHLVDFARSWTERWYQIIDDPGSTLVGWDPDELADLRGYRMLPTVPALRTFDGAVRALVSATVEAGPDAAFTHGDWGAGHVGDATIWMGHEFHHHELDVRERVR